MMSLLFRVALGISVVQANDGLDSLRPCMSPKDKMRPWSYRSDPPTYANGREQLEARSWFYDRLFQISQEDRSSLSRAKVATLPKDFQHYIGNNGWFSHNRLAVCGPQSGSLRVPRDESIYVARFESTGPPVCAC